MPSLVSLGFLHNQRPRMIPDEPPGDFSHNTREAITPYLDQQIVEVNQQLPEKSIDFAKLAIDTLRVRQYIESDNYVAGVSGFRINMAPNDGDVEFGSGTFRGALIAGEIHIPDRDTTANSFHTSTAGLSWWGATETNVATAPARMNTTGLLTLGNPAATHLQLDGPNVRMRSSDFVTGVTGFNISASLIEAQNLVARGIMRGSTFSFDVISAVGGQVMVANADVLSTDMTALDASTLTVRGTSTFAVNDILVIRAQTALGIQEEFLRVTNIASAPTYTVTRDLAGSFAADTNPIWQRGTPVVKQGVSDGAAAFGGGWLRLFGEGTNSPFYSVFVRTGVAYNSSVEVCRLGNLNGIGGFVADTFGVFIGSTTDSTKRMTYDSVSGDLIVNGRTFGSEPIYGDGSDGAVTIAAPTTLTRDMFYTTLVVNAGATLNPGGFRIFASTSVTVNGTIARNGNDGSNATAGVLNVPGTAGAAGAALAAGSLFGSPAVVASGGGGEDPGGGGGTDPGDAGTAGTAVTSAIGGNGAVGAAGGAGGTGGGGGGGGAGGGAGAAGVATASGTLPRSAATAILMIDTGSTVQQLRPSAGTGGSGGGGSGRGGINAGAQLGGGGGGAGGHGSGGGIVVVASPTITIAAAGAIRANGGAAGNGAAGGAGQDGPIDDTRDSGGGGGGAGGSGGNGGTTALFYTTLTNNGAITVTGGAAGSGGAGGAGASSTTAGTAGTAGNVGNTGTSLTLQLR